MDSGHGHTRRGKDAPIIYYTDYVNICKGGNVKFLSFYDKKTLPVGEGCPFRAIIERIYATRTMETVMMLPASGVAVSAALVLTVIVEPSVTRISAWDEPL